MPLYSNSPLGIVFSSSSDAKNLIPNYIISASESNIRSIFSDKDTFSFNPFSTSDKTFNNKDGGSDIKTLSIIKYTEDIPAMKLKYSDFAFLKNLGVYPNNRLIVARRYDSPVADDLTTLPKTISPISTLVSWVPDNTDFISTEFGEEWDNSEASFRGILNDLGKDTMVGDNKDKILGDFLGGGGGIIPLPGFTEGLQYEVFKQLGMSDLDASNIPYGNPNLIRESKKRRTLDKEKEGSGLKCKFKIEMIVEYEQKFINGVDPTTVYYDIIANALTFGTSESQFQFKKGDNVSEFSAFIDKIGSGDPAKLKEALLQFITAVSDALGQIGKNILSGIENAKNQIIPKDDKEAKQIRDDADEAEKVKKNDALSSVANYLSTIGSKIVQGLVNKYKIRLLGVVNSLTGTPSTPWHVTVGNPRRPIFSSGDMLVESVTITFGKVLAFNDLPSSLKLKFELASARNLGSQEIFTKFNCGKERTYVKLRKSNVESDFVIGDAEYNKALGDQKIKRIYKNAIVTTESMADPTKRKEEASKVGSEQFPNSINKLKSVKYDADSNGQVYAKVNIVLKDAAGNLKKGGTITEFQSDGVVKITDEKNVRRAIGVWIPNQDGSVDFKSNDPEYGDIKI